MRVLQNPVAAALLGFLFAFVLLRASRASFRRIDPGAASLGVAKAATALFARLLIATLALWVYKNYLNQGLKPFAFALAGGFVVMYTVELVRYSGLLKRRSAKSATRRESVA